MGALPNIVGNTFSVCAITPAYTDPYLSSKSITTAIFAWSEHTHYEPRTLQSGGCGRERGIYPAPMAEQVDSFPRHPGSSNTCVSTGHRMADVQDARRDATRRSDPRV
eukprot:2318414-Rhodomonas_salina.3